MTLIFFNNSKNKSKGILKEINKRLYGIFLFNVSTLFKNNIYKFPIFKYFGGMI
jgi:hypothetical protein